MEIHINGKAIFTPDNTDSLTRFFQAAKIYEIKAMQKYCKNFTVNTTSELDKLIENDLLVEYLEGIEVIQHTESEINFQFTCGGYGLDFIAQFLKIIGPNCEHATAECELDDDPSQNGDWPAEVVYCRDTIRVNDKPYHGGQLDKAQELGDSIGNTMRDFSQKNGINAELLASIYFDAKKDDENDNKPREDNSAIKRIINLFKGK